MKKRANILLALGLSSALCFSLASVIQTNAGAEGEGTFSLDGELEESYDVGERLNLPKGTFTVDGKNYEAVTTLYNPDGTVTAADSVTLKTEGRYTLEYTCTQTGQAEEYTFTVDKDLIEFDGEGLIKSSSVYGKDESVYDTGLTGLNVELYANETMNFNQVIDLNDFSAGESIFKMYVIPETLGYYNARTLKFRFTDIYDPDNYVDVYASAMQVAEPEKETNVTKFNTTYLLGGANGQVPTGIEWRNTDGTLYTVHQANLFGFLAPVSPYGYKNKQENVGKEYLELGFDLNEKTVTSTSSEGKSNVVVDLDAEYMNTKWKGFTTGEVRLSVTAREYRTNKIPYRMIFTEITVEGVYTVEFLLGVYVPIETEAELFGINEHLDGWYLLMNDIVLQNNMEGASEELDGEDGTKVFAYNKPVIGVQNNAFTGIFDGNGFTISNLKFKQLTDEYIGLFGGNNGTIRNLVLEHEIWKNSAGQNQGFRNKSGALVGLNRGTIENCYVKATVMGCQNNQWRASGAIAGYATGASKIVNCFVEVDWVDLFDGAGAIKSGGAVTGVKEGAFEPQNCWYRLTDETDTFVSLSGDDPAFAPEGNGKIDADNSVPEGFDASAFPSEIWNIVVEGEGASAKIKEIGLKRNCSYSSN